VFPGDERPDRVQTVVLPLSASYFDPSGWFFKITGTYLNQKVWRPLSLADSATEQEDTFLVGAKLGYRLPNRRGIFSVEVENLLDQDFRYQDDNFRSSEERSPRFVPEQTWLARLTLSF
jgi:TonB dependent receptor